MDEKRMIGRTISHYTITAELGRGGMGVVYRAEDERLGRSVALKLLPPAAASDHAAKERFVQEARAASSFDHPNICTIHDIGETDGGELYLVMPVYEGGTLRDRMESGPMEVADAAGYALQIATGLSRAHQTGMVHRDIKPDNLMVLEDGLVKILDFGVAKLAEGLDLTISGSTVGTAAYMSPEQARGEDVDGRSDLWALGAILYEALSGRRPFPGGYDQAVIYGILNSDPDPLTETPEDLAAVVHRLLEKDRDERYESAEEVVAALRPFTADGGSAVQVASRTGRFSRGFVIGLAVVAIFAVGAAFFLGQTERAPTITPDPALAVLPFEVRGSPDLAYLGQGLPTLLSTSINGMGDLRAVDPLSVSSVLGDAEVDAEAAQMVARRFEAEGVVIGSVVQLGQEIRLQATIYDSDGNAGETQEAVAVSQEELPSAVDALARSLIAGRFQGRGQSMASLSAITSQSFEALRQYMDGEALSRSAEWPAAYEAFSEAVELDSTFALAWYRMSSLDGWNGVFGNRESDILAASRHSQNLPPRVRRLIAAQSAYAHDSTWTALQRWEEYLERYPDDAHAWFRFGDLVLHSNPSRGQSDREALPLLRRAIALDPSNHEAAVHLLAYALKDREWEYVDSFHAAAGDLDTFTARVNGLFRDAGDDSARLISQLHSMATASGEPARVWDEAFSTSLAMRWPEVQIAAVDSSGFLGGEMDSPDSPYLKVSLLVQLGQLRAASRVIESTVLATGQPLSLVQALTPLTFAPGADSIFSRTFNPGLADNPLAKAVSAYLEKDWPAGRQWVDTLQAGAQSWAGGAYHGTDFASLALWSQGDLKGALALAEPLQPVDGMQGIGNYPTVTRRWILGELYFLLGRYEDAKRMYNTLFGVDSFVSPTAAQYATPAHRRLAEMAEVEGDTDEAIHHYEMVLRYWYDVDPELQPVVDEVQNRLDVLLGAQGRESG
jgi:tetratricopeptide (TPR) repeat protein